MRISASASASLRHPAPRRRPQLASTPLGKQTWKALWSKKRVKQNKVTMLGRVMGCMEQVFVHDSYGRPVYFETYSGHAPVGEYVLSLFEKIEQSLQEPGGPRVIG